MDVNGVSSDRIDIPAELSSLILSNVRLTGRKIGASGSVEEVEIPGAVCAAKKIDSEILNGVGSSKNVEDLVSRFVSECRLLSTLRHPHIVQFLGICYLPGAKLPSLILERLDTNLHDLLEINRDLPLATKQWILLDISRGLLYLHSQSPPIVHQCLTSRNILLDCGLRAKISDVGLARIINHQLSRKNRGAENNIVHIPPEAMKEHVVLDTSIDIFSFGNIILYIFTQEFLGPNFKPSSCTNPNSSGDSQILSEIERREHAFGVICRMLGKESALVKLAQGCLRNDPSDRPSAGELVDRISALTSGAKFQSKVEVMRQLSRAMRKNEQLQNEISSLQMPTQGPPLHDKQTKNDLEKRQLLKQV